MLVRVILYKRWRYNVYLLKICVFLVPLLEKYYELEKEREDLITQEIKLVR